MTRRDALRLAMLGLFLTAMLALAVVAITPSTLPPTVAVPTLMQLPQVPAVAALPSASAVPQSTTPEALPVAALESAAPPANTATLTVAPSEIPAEMPNATLTPTIVPLIVIPTVPVVEVNPSVVSQPVPDQVVIAFAPASSSAERVAYIASIGGVVTGEISALDTVVVSVSAQVAAEPLPASAVVARAELDYTVHALAAAPPSDPLYPQQWALTAIGAVDAWAALPSGQAPAAVAVIDSGVCADLPDLAGRILPGWDFI